MSDPVEFEVEPFHIKDFVMEFWKKRTHIISITATILLLTIAWLSSTDRIYRASIIMKPATETVGSGGGALGQLTGLAGLAGIGDTQFDLFNEYLALLRSPDLARRIDAKRGLVKIFNASLWDEQTSQWVEPRGVSYVLKRFVKDLLGYPDWTEPNYITLQNQLSSKLSIMPHSVGTRLRKIDLSLPDGNLAKEVLGLMIDEANLILRENSLKNTEAQISYLQARLSAAVNTDHRSALRTLLLEQERKYMLLQSPTGPGAIIFDPIVLEPNPVFPKITVSLILALFASGIISLVYVYLSFRFQIRERKKD